MRLIRILAYIHTDLVWNSWKFCHIFALMLPFKSVLLKQTFSCALDTFLGKTSCLFLPHLSNLAVRNEFTELLFSTCSRYCWNYCHFIFSRSCFRPEVSLSIIVKCNVNRGAKWQGSEMEDHVQPIGLVFITMREWFLCNLKEVRVLVNALSVVKSFYFYMKFSRLIQITKPVK